ncbi:polyhydroxyalkanoate synthesis repressor PhaR [Oryzomicrobium sp.]|uniref:polyhydroxyalkanoate synthesis repressor PhaR n=1 Tax=Oryzomicrobium sp. TaxID=1911578 RepID=UPI0025D5913F|nr:polyhydroxyalkanoate synthesis repressor PhaR [Oryzomicrobium sp.]MCE1244082.1 polyhydroxyalkanoate synthesis repressor PhaR [Oryzomicrobium sp.]
MSDQTRLIKKYPNRRLYDTKTSAYITLADVKDLVLRFEEFKVVDAKGGEDLTRSILLQIILEEETGGVPIFSTEVLAQMIRFYGNAMQAMLSKYLETNMRAFVDFQGKVQEQSRSMYGDNKQMQSDMWAQFLNFQGPAMQSMMSAYMDQSKKMFQQMQAQIESQTRNMFSGGFPFPGTPGAPGAPGAAGTNPGNKPDGKKTEKAG